MASFAGLAGGRGARTVAGECREQPGGVGQDSTTRCLTFVAAGARLSPIPLAVSTAGRGASSEALALSAGVDAHRCLCRWVQSLLRGAQRIFLEVVGLGGTIRESAAAPSRHSCNQVLHGKSVGHIQRSVEAPATRRISTRPPALSTRSRNLSRPLPQSHSPSTPCATAWATAHGGGHQRPRKTAPTSISPCIC